MAKQGEISQFQGHVSYSQNGEKSPWYNCLFKWYLTLSSIDTPLLRGGTG
jgi:hypothetical protein